MFYLVHEFPDPGNDTNAVVSKDPFSANFVLKWLHLESFGQRVREEALSLNLIILKNMEIKLDILS